MEKKLHITTTLDEPVFLEDLVEKLACRRYDLGYGKAIVPKEWEPLELSTTETYAGGVTALEEQDEIINMPFITRFLFTCTKSNGGAYKLAWSASLS